MITMECQPGGHGAHLGHSMMMDPSSGSVHHQDQEHKKKRDGGSHVGSSSGDGESCLIFQLRIHQSVRIIEKMLYLAGQFFLVTLIVGETKTGCVIDNLLISGLAALKQWRMSERMKLIASPRPTGLRLVPNQPINRP
ncbi:hypothetical protein Zmor_005048 [Zophobas morio]|uniref:Uncharacterized protein n=1 Tax=Zophobas morio TaxID=2755281 RepID=A0AA38MLZ4_9CUCU|nr:hypothetical protein Zmor_005048 [Zophobas morio]